MFTANLNSLDLTEFQGKNRPEQHCRGTFPLLGALGAENSAVVYFELSPDKSLGRHTDSEEEVLLILDGTVEVQVGDESGLLSQGEIALVPRMVPHDLHNVSDKPARVVGFFGAPNIVATFDTAWENVGSHTVDTAQMPAPTAT